MKQCVNDIVAFVLNQRELDLVAFGVIIVLAIVLGRWLLSYLNYGLETKEERWARKNPFLAVDMDLHPRGKKRDVW